MILYALVMEMTAKNNCYPTALLKVKYIRHSMNPESIPFEDLINSTNTSIKIDFPDGRFLMEKGFRSVNVPVQKFYLEFFDEYDLNEMMDYLSSEESDFRATSLDGSVVRPSKSDLASIPTEIKEDSSEKKLKEYVFVKEKKGVFQRFREFIHKKDN